MRFVRAQSPERTYDWNYSTKLRDALISSFDRSGSKCNLPLLHLETAGNTTSNRHLICVDLDKLPEAQSILASIQKVWPATALSPSRNGVKIFLTIQGDLPHCLEDFKKLKEEVSEQFFSKFEDSSWAASWDDAVVSLTRCFATMEIGEAALKAVEVGPQVVRWGVGSRLESRTIVSNLDSISSHRYLSLHNDKPLPSGLREFIGIGTESLERAALLRVLVLMRKLPEGFDLPQKKLAAQLGVSISLINKWIKELIGRGWLQVVNHSYCPGVKAKTYKASGALLYAIQELARVKTSKKPLPLAVENGRFYSQCLGALWYFSSEDAFLIWLRTLPGMTETRYKEGSRYARSHFRKVARSPNERRA